MLGHDPSNYGAVPSFRAEATKSLLLPARIPDGLRAPMISYLKELSGTEIVNVQDLQIPGSLEVERILDRTDSSENDVEFKSESDDSNTDGFDDDMQGMGDHMDGMGHMDDMMAIDGEPSPDGLVMETIEVSYGPVAVPFPGGLMVKATLDGDVATEVSITGLAKTAKLVPGPPAIPDPLAPIAWATAIEIATDTVIFRTSLVPGLELERAISHLAWLRSLSRLIGWSLLTRHTTAALTELAAIELEPLRSKESVDLDNARLNSSAAEVSKVLALLRGSRLLRWRLAGRGVVSPERVKELDVDGLNARASGLRRDGRIGNPAYAALNFEPLLERGGDAAARTLLRVREASQSIELTRASLALQTEPTADTGNPCSCIEGPRGILLAAHDARNWRLEAPGADNARLLTADLMRGETWVDALSILASFDLSPWPLANE